MSINASATGVHETSYVMCPTVTVSGSPPIPTVASAVADGDVLPVPAVHATARHSDATAAALRIVKAHSRLV
jgi:hypothetical protein